MRSRGAPDFRSLKGYRVTPPDRSRKEGMLVKGSKGGIEAIDVIKCWPASFSDNACMLVSDGV